MKKTIATDFDWINYKKEDLEKFGGQIKELIKSYKQEILKIEKKDLSFRNFIHRSEILSADIGKHDGALFAYVNLHTDENIRNTARKMS